MVATIERVLALRALVSGEASACDHLARAAALFERAGDIRNAAIQRANLGSACKELGAYAEAERVLTEALAAADRLRLPPIAASARSNLGCVLARLGRLDDAELLEAEAMAAFAAQGDRRMAGASRVYLAMILALRGDAEGAAREAAAAVAELERWPPLRANALAMLSRAELARGRPEEALARAREAAAIFEALGTIEEGEALVRLALVEALGAAGEHEAARAAVTVARERLFARAARLADPAARARFLAVPEHARTIDLAAASEAPR